MQPNVNIWRCEYHLKAETRHGVEVADKKVYGQLVRVPKNNGALSDQIHNHFSVNSSFRKLPKEQISQSHLPLGVCLHGNTTGNIAEIAHTIMDSVRSQETFLHSMLQVSNLLLRCSYICKPILPNSVGHFSSGRR